MTSKEIIGLRLASGMEILGVLAQGSGARTSDMYLDVRSAIEVITEDMNLGTVTFVPITALGKSSTPWMDIQVPRSLILVEYAPRDSVVAQYLDLTEAPKVAVRADEAYAEHLPQNRAPRLSIVGRPVSTEPSTGCHLS